ncbi:hypothetical protein Tco_1488282, partial [Tanacetum coccineum]
KTQTILALGLSWCPIRVITAFDEFLRDFGLPAWHIHVGGGVSVGDGFGGMWGVNEVERDRFGRLWGLAGNGVGEVQCFKTRGEVCGFDRIGPSWI